MPFVTELRPSSFQLGGVRRTEFVAPVPDRFVGEENAAKGHHEFHIPQAQGEVEIQPDALGNDLFGKSITAIRVSWHSLRISSALLDNTGEGVGRKPWVTGDVRSSKPRCFATRP